MVCKGAPFPFWMRGQALLILKVSTAAPDDVVRLAPGAEVSIAPRPRVRKQQASDTPTAMPAAQDKESSLPSAWFRIQVHLTRLCHAQHHPPWLVDCMERVCVSPGWALRGQA